MSNIAVIEFVRARMGRDDTRETAPWHTFAGRWLRQLVHSASMPEGKEEADGPAALLAVRTGGR
ncbi:MAG TPA: hypothetical protein VMT20_08125 [Terriglobia bacterium]|nr:hypothetical protein [Terriglobia bacterium]